MGFANLPEMVMAVVQYYIARKMLDAQIEARERMSVLAEENLRMAEELFEDTMVLRAYDTQVYDFMKELPSYEICQNHIIRGRISGHLRQNVTTKSFFGHSRYNCGNRRQQIAAALGDSLLSGGEMSVNAAQYEEMIQDAYDKLRWSSITTSAAFNEFNAAKPFGAVADNLASQHSAASEGLGGSLAALGYNVSSIFQKQKEASYERAVEKSNVDLDEQVFQEGSELF